MPRTSATPPLAALFFTVIAAGCGSSTTLIVADASTDTPVPTVDTPGTPPDASVDVPSDQGSFPDLGPGMCNVDFPCSPRIPGNRWQCRGAGGYVLMETHDCHYACGPGPCGGGSCDPTGGAFSCPAGQSCVNDTGSPGGPDAGPLAPCQDARDASTDVPMDTTPDATPDAGTCTRPAGDLSAAGMNCTGDGGMGSCPAPYVCHPDEGFVLAHACTWFCTTDCDCPVGGTCQDASDKVSHWRACMPVPHVHP